MDAEKRKKEEKKYYYRTEEMGRGGKLGEKRGRKMAEIISQEEKKFLKFF